MTPSAVPSVVPSAKPSVTPSVVPSAVPTATPSALPSRRPTQQPTYGVVKAVDMGSTTSFAVLGSTVATTGSSLLVGNVISTTLTGSPTITGTAYLSSDAVAVATLLDLQTATNDAADRPVTREPLAASLTTGTVILPGVYSWSSSLQVPNGATIKLDANNQADAVWIFQVSTTLAVGTDCRIEVINNVTENKNVFWSVKGAVAIGARSHVVGTVLGQNAITTQSGALTGPLFTTSKVFTLTVNNAVVVAYKPEASVLETRSPTAAPTEMTEPSMDFNVTSNYQGYTGPVNADGSVTLDDASKASIIDAFGQIMNISTSAITITGAHTTGSRRSLLNKKRTYDAVDILVTTLIKVNLVDYPQFQSNTTTAFQTIVQTLRDALDSNVLTDQIIANAIANGADSLLAIVVTAVNSDAPLVQQPPTRQPTSAPRDDDDNLEDGPIAGIVIGVLIGTAFILIGLYYGLTKYRESTYPKEFMVNIEAEDTHVIDVMDEPQPPAITDAPHTAPVAAPAPIVTPYGGPTEPGTEVMSLNEIEIGL